MVKTKKKYSFQNRTKLTVTMFTLAFVAIAAITAVITVFAFSRQTVTGSVKITYKASEVNATVSSWYQKEGGTKTDILTNEGNSEISISAGQEVTESFVLDSAIELDNTSKYVLFGYTFTNNGSLAFAASHKLDLDITNNMEVTYSINGTNYDSLDAGFSLGYGETLTYYVKVEIQNMVLNAELEGTVSWELGKLTSATGTDITTDTARIGTTTYSTFDEAYNAAQYGDIVVISEDVTLPDSFGAKNTVTIIAENRRISSELSASSTDSITITTPKSIDFASFPFRIGSVSGKTINLKTSNPNTTQIFYLGSGATLYLNNVTFIKPNTMDKQRIIYADTGSYVEMNGVNVSNFIDDDAVVISNEKIIILNSAFTNNTNAIRAAKVFHSENNLFESNINAVVLSNLNTSADIRNSKFLSNSSTSNGGAISVKDMSIVWLTILDTIFEGNEATSLGGAIYNNVGATNSEIKIKNSQFIKNKATDYSAIYSEAGFVLSDSTFTDNSATVKGLIYNKDILRISNSEFNGNFSPGYMIFSDISKKGGNISNSNFSNNTAQTLLYSPWGVNIKNSTFEKNTVSSYLLDGPCSIEDSTFSENTASGQLISYAQTIHNTNFTKNTANSVLITGISISDSIFSENSAQICFKLNMGEIKNSQFIKNVATKYSLINSSESKLKVKGSTFKENSAVQGGAIQSTGEIMIDDCEFISNTSTSNASAIYSENKTTISNSTFSNNIASGNGTIFSFAELNILGSTFTENSALQGGAIYSEGTLNIVSTIFDGNTITAQTQGYGGGAINHTSGTFNIDNCEFKNNKVNLSNQCYGGAINGRITLCNNSSFTNNSGAAGGAIYGGGKFINTTFTSNSAGKGGALYGSTITLENCELVGNSASSDGGAIAILENLYCVSTKFSENTAEGYGGAIAKWTDKSGTMVYDSCEFIKNTSAKDGGAVFSYMEICNIINSQFTENSAENGGALFIQYEDAVMEGVRYTTENFEERSAIIDGNCIFISNTTKKDGGAIYFAGGISTIKNSTIKNTITGGNGAIYSAFSSIEVLNSDISNNTAGDGAGVCGYNNSTIAIKDGAKINSNIASVRGGGIRVLTTSTLLMKGGEISNNVVSKSGTLSMTYGGGVCVSSGCTMEMTGGTIHLNKAINSTYKLGGNVYIDSADTSSSPTVPQAVFNMRGGTISGDGITQQATIGGGVGIFGEFNMTGGTISKCLAEIGGGVLNVGTSTITGGSILECVASNNANNSGKAIANNGVLNLGNVTLGVGQDISMGYQKVTLGASVFPEGYGALNVVENLTNTYTITFAQVTGFAPAISNGTTTIKHFVEEGTVFATYSNGAVLDVNDFVASGYTFYENSGNLYMKAAS